MNQIAVPQSRWKKSYSFCPPVIPALVSGIISQGNRAQKINLVLAV